ncbi:transmembrane protein 41B-like [Centruroides sculpturatus]|uniref:transmembrane protein 41B-like n=1 Tax=Centruroides sculpturatus TaxID=218467 RepID=UPI000C6CD584|nr:transmembrane protein 41B-like [Centruroides sculpturatus]
MHPDKKENVQSTSQAFLVLIFVFITSVFSLLMVYYRFPELESDEIQYMKLPQNIDDAKNLGKVLSHYKDRYFFTVLGGYFVMYIFLQSFAIPGSIFLSILSGFLFPFPLAIFMVCLVSFFQVNKHRSHLLNYIIFLRITPFLPNWFINITSPVIDVPLFHFFVGTFIGVAPPSFLAIKAGTTLHQLTSSTDAISWFSIAVLGIFALVSLLPVMFNKKLQSKLE